jgi:hypothetical protein
MKQIFIPENIQTEDNQWINTKHTLPLQFTGDVMIDANIQ